MTLTQYILEHPLPAEVRVADAAAGSVKPGSHRKLRWRCAQGHSWEAPVYSVALDGCGCPYCAGKLPIPGKTDLATLEPELTAQFDREKNDLQPEQLLPSSHAKVWWRCSLGHSWQAAPFSRIGEKGSGCPYCTGKKVLPGFNDLATLKPGVAEQWHPTLNGTLSPREVSLGSNKKVWWRCGLGHSWQAAIYSRTRKNAAGCPICAGTVKQSRRFHREQPSYRANPHPTIAPTPGAD